MSEQPTDLPPHDQYADDDDTLDWDVTRLGRMVDYATDDEPPTEPV